MTNMVDGFKIRNKQYYIINGRWVDENYVVITYQKVNELIKEREDGENNKRSRRR